MWQAEHETRGVYIWHNTKPVVIKPYGKYDKKTWEVLGCVYRLTWEEEDISKVLNVNVSWKQWYVCADSPSQLGD